MIYFVCTEKHSYTIRQFIDGPGRPLRPRMRVVPYHRIVSKDSLPFGTYVFSDYERLVPAVQPAVVRARRQLVEAGVPVLNDPSRAMRRYALLEYLADAGINSYRAYPLRDRPKPQRFPVFVRWENDHEVADPVLIPDQPALDRAIENYLVDPRLVEINDELLVVEFIDTRGADGLYRKYATFRIGDRLIPRQIHSSEDWVVKRPDVDSEALAEEERRFLESEETLPLLRRVFDAAAVEYGRIDFAYAEGRIQIFEINSNPTVVGPLSLAMEHRGESYRQIAEKICAAFEAVDTDEQRPPIPMRP